MISTFTLSFTFAPLAVTSSTAIGAMVSLPSGTTIHSAAGLRSVPTTLFWPRSNISTISPLYRICPERTPFFIALATTVSPVIADALSSGLTKRSPSAFGSSGVMKPKPLRFSRNVPVTRLGIDGSETMPLAPLMTRPFLRRVSKEFLKSAISLSATPNDVTISESLTGL